MPVQYAKWAQAVSKPYDIYSGVGVAELGQRGTGAYDGSYSSSSLGTWSAVVTSANGFASTNVANCCGTSYEEYYVDMVVPSSTCSGNCNTLLWAGLGGFLTSVLGTTFGNVALIQSGFNLVGTGISNTLLYYEYWPSFGTQVMNPPSGDTFAVGDAFEIWGWASSSSNCQVLSTGAWACFWFQDDTHNWGVAGTPLQYQSGNWLPSTIEYAAEHSSWANATFSAMEMSNLIGWDSNGNAHYDSANGNDPYVINNQTDSSGFSYNYPRWNNNTYDTPKDPLWLYFNVSN